MGYYTRVLTKRDGCVPYAELSTALRKKHPKLVLDGEGENPDAWEHLILRHPDGREIASIERNSVMPGSLGQGEIAEFIEEIGTCKPQSAVAWLRQFLEGVKNVYAFQHLSGTEIGRGAEALSVVSETIWAQGDAIMQADGEGFSNEDGYHILWQFNDRVSGPWWMAVRQGKRWVSFQMELGDERQRAAFFEGRVP